ncbi:MAG TPA: glycosyltransferase family 2 protein [Chloroflexi bacterium]|nr:glycosyltransferase family 2 protein [Chloroflexota bacterium]
MTELAGVIITLNEEAHIEECIASLRWTDEVIVFDSFSTDRTVELAEKAGARVIQHPFENFGAQRNAALQAIDAEWVFFVDADERATPELATEIRQKIGGVERGWWVPRHNYIFGRLTLGAGWFPDYQLRVLHRTSARYDPGRPVHEEVILDGEAGYLESPLIHYNYRDLAHFIAKQETYTDFEAGIRYGKGLRPRPWTYLSGPLRQFWWRFVTLHGYRDGLHGLTLSLLMAYYEYQTWRRVARCWRGEAPPASQGR